MKLITILFVALFCASAQAQTYKCKTPDGKTISQDRRCKDETSLEIVRGSDYVPDPELRAAEQRRANNRASQLRRPYRRTVNRSR